MKRLTATLVAAAALLGSTLAGTALGQDTNAQGALGAPQASNAQKGWDDQSDQARYRGEDSGWDQNGSSQGSDRNDRNGSNQGSDRNGSNEGSDRNGSNWGSDRNGSNWGSDRGRFDRTILEGRWIADDRAADNRSDRGAFRGRGPMREMLLPDRIRIDQKPSMVRIADSRNHALQLIMLGGKFDSRRGSEADYRHGGRADYVSGWWRGSTLVVERSGQRGATITQTFALENRGRTLVVRTRREGFGPRTMEITSTYRRA